MSVSMNTDQAPARAQSSRHSKHSVVSMACNAMHHTSEMFLHDQAVHMSRSPGGHTYMVEHGWAERERTRRPWKRVPIFHVGTGCGVRRMPHPAIPADIRIHLLVCPSAPIPNTFSPVHHHVSPRSHFGCRMRRTVQPALASAQAHRRRQKPAAGPSGRVCQTLLFLTERWCCLIG